MKTGYILLSTAAVVPLLACCASYQKAADTDTWRIKPVMSVRHSIENPDAYYQLGRYYQGQNRYEQAILAYQKALALDGNFAEARNGLGVIYSAQARMAEAIEQFRLAVELAPAVAHIHNNLGYAQYLGGAYAEAAQTLEHAVRLDPANQATRINLAQAKEKAGTARQMIGQAPQTQLPEKLTAESREVLQPSSAEAREVALPVAPRPAAPPTVAANDAPAISATGAIPTPVQAVPPMTRVAVRAVALPVEAHSRAKDGTVSVIPATAILQPEQQRQGEASVAGAKRSVVPMVESHVQVVQLATNVYKLQERAQASGMLVQPDLSKTQAKKPGMVMPVVQARPIPVRMAQGQTHAGPISQVAYEQSVSQARTVAAPSGSAKKFRLEVSNGNGLTGMARNVANFLVDFGYVGSRLTNQKSYQVQLSEVHYRTGYRDEALSLMSSLPGKPVLIEVDSLRQDINIKVVLGKDWLREIAYFDRSHQGKIRLVRTGSDT